MQAAAARQKYTYADHLDAHPEIITRENLEALCRLRASGWKKRAKLQEVSAMATHLKVPNAECRDSQRALVRFLEDLMWHLHCAVVIKEKGIEIGSEVFGPKVKKIGRDRQLTLEDGSRCSPSQLDPDYHAWVKTLYGGKSWVEHIFEKAGSSKKS